MTSGVETHEEFEARLEAAFGPGAMEELALSIDLEMLEGPVVVAWYSGKLQHDDDADDPRAYFVEGPFTIEEATAHIALAQRAHAFEFVELPRHEIYVLRPVDAERTEELKRVVRRYEENAGGDSPG